MRLVWFYYHHQFIIDYQLSLSDITLPKSQMDVTKSLYRINKFYTALVKMTNQANHTTLYTMKTQTVAQIVKLKVKHQTYVLMEINPVLLLGFFPSEHSLTLNRLEKRATPGVKLTSSLWFFKKCIFWSGGWNPAFLWLFLSTYYHKLHLSWKFHLNSSCRSENMKTFSVNISYFHRFSSVFRFFDISLLERD